jgi:hypothetical protein
MNTEGMVALLNYREDGITRQYSLSIVSDPTLTAGILTAYLTFWKDGLKEVKL